MSDIILDGGIEGQCLEISFSKHVAYVHHLLQRQREAVDAMERLGTQEFVLQVHVAHQRFQDLTSFFFQRLEVYSLG